MPRVSADDARGILCKRKRFSPRRKREMKKMELLYLPYYVHRVVISQRDDQHEIIACTDGISNIFSFFDAKQMEFCNEASGEVFDFLVSAEEARRACRESLRWHLVRQGLRLKVKASVKEIREVREIHYPYWVGYFRGGDGYDFRAADAVTGETQGVRMRETFLAAFSHSGDVATNDIGSSLAHD
ncbi:hypothetical protein HQ563_08665 [bacterium]|nr:hypothetical protein [bacterium]